MIPFGPDSGVGRSNSVMAPSKVMRPTLWPLDSVNHIAPSTPAATPIGVQVGLGSANSVIAPSVTDNRPIWPGPDSQNQTHPSEPAATM
jgi:hypothetical protein